MVTELNFQPDEFVSLRGVRELDLLAGHIKAPGAYFEGTFNYYLWAVPQAVLKLRANKNAGLGDPIDAEGVADLLYISRWISVLVDLCTIVIVFLAIREATQKFYPSIFGRALLRCSANAGDLRTFHEDSHFEQFVMRFGHLVVI